MAIIKTLYVLIARFSPLASRETSITINYTSCSTDIKCKRAEAELALTTISNTSLDNLHCVSMSNNHENISKRILHYPKNLLSSALTWNWFVVVRLWRTQGGMINELRLLDADSQEAQLLSRWKLIDFRTIQSHPFMYNAHKLTDKKIIRLNFSRYRNGRERKVDPIPPSVSFFHFSFSLLIKQGQHS